MVAWWHDGRISVAIDASWTFLTYSTVGLPEHRPCAVQLRTYRRKEAKEGRDDVFSVCLYNVFTARDPLVNTKNKTGHDEIPSEPQMS